MLSVLLALAAALFAAPTGEECPDITLVDVPADFLVGPDLTCSGVRAEVSNVRVSTEGRCPSFILITPKHHKQVSSPGSCTYTKPSGSFVDITKHTYECRLSWFLIIPIGSRCALKDSSVVGRLPIYELLRCPEC